MTSWKVGETCIYRGIYGTVSLLMGQSAQVECDDYRRVMVPLAELTRPPGLTRYQPTGRWDSGNRLAALPGSPIAGLCAALRANRRPKMDMTRGELDRCPMHPLRPLAGHALESRWSLLRLLVGRGALCRGRGNNFRRRLAKSPD